MDSRQLSPVERFLNLFTEVRPGEGTTALLMFANVFLILLAYYCIKPLREGWIAVSDIQGLSKMEVKAYSSFAQSILLLFLVGWYAKLAANMDRVTLITRATLFCISNMLLFWFLQVNQEYFIAILPMSGLVYYLWVGMFGVFVVAQFWTFCADIYSNERGKRMLPMIAVGATSGAAFGSWLVHQLVGSQIIATANLLLLAILPLLVSIGLTRMVERRTQEARLAEQRAAALESSPDPAMAKEDSVSEKPVSLIDGARLVLMSKFLLFAVLVTLLTNWVNTNGENLLFRVIQETLSAQAMEQGITDEAGILAFTRDGTTAFYGNFYFWVNIVALILQAFVASRLLKYGGFGAILLILPVIALASYTVMALLPVLYIVKMMKIAENATDYSLNNTSRHVLWLPVSSSLKFRAKPAIDTIYQRVGDALAAITVLLGVHVFMLSTSGFFAFNVFLVLLWLVFGWMLLKEHRKATAAAEAGHPLN